MKNNHVASAFYELVKGSYSEIIEASDINSEIIEVAKKCNIVIPSPDIAILKTTYCEVGIANKNGDLLPKEAVKKALPTLISKNVNFNHEALRGQICGHIIDAKLEGELVIIYAVIFKSLFPKQIRKCKELFKNGTLSVSMEVWDKDPNTGESVVTERPDGVCVIDPIIFHGCGILIDGELPACPKAYAKKLMACFKEEETENINNLVFASLSKEEKCLNCTNCKCKKEENKLDIFELMFGDNNILQIESASIEEWEDDYKDVVDIEIAKKLTYDEKKNLKDEDFALIKEVKNKKTGEPRKIRMFVINDVNHINNALARLNQKAVEETLKKLGVSKEEVLKNIVKKAKELGMDEVVKKYGEANIKKCSDCGEELKEDEVDICGKCKNKKAETENASISDTQGVNETTEEAKASIETAKETTDIISEATPAEAKEAEAKPVEEVKPPVLMKTIEETKKIVTVEYVNEVAQDNTRTEECKVLLVKIMSDGSKTEEEHEYKAVDTYTSEQLEVKIAEVKAELQKEIDKLSLENASLKENVTKKEVEVETLNASLKKVNEHPVIDLSIGSVTPDVKIKDNCNEIARNIDNMAFPKRS